MKIQITMTLEINNTIESISHKWTSADYIKDLTVRGKAAIKRISYVDGATVENIQIVEENN